MSTTSAVVPSEPFLLTKAAKRPRGPRGPQELLNDKKTAAPRSLVTIMKRQRTAPPLGDRSRVLRFTLEYDGTHFHGSQLQPNVRTVQGELERAIGNFTSEALRVVLASRTDRGVHALGQCALVRTRSLLPPAAFLRGLNTFLPDDLAVRSMNECPNPNWDPKTSATGKHYRYCVICGPDRPVLERHQAWYVKAAGIKDSQRVPDVAPGCLLPVLDVDRMRGAASCLVVGHPLDCTSFGNLDKGRPPDNPMCHISSLVIAVVEFPGNASTCALTIDIAADRFVYKMVRNIVGTLIDIGLHGAVDEEGTGSASGEGRRSMAKILAARERTSSAQGAPAVGLRLVEVFYPPEHFSAGTGIATKAPPSMAGAACPSADDNDA